METIELKGSKLVKERALKQTVIQKMASLSKTSQFGKWVQSPFEEKQDWEPKEVEFGSFEMSKIGKTNIEEFSNLSEIDNESSSGESGLQHEENISNVKGTLDKSMESAKSKNFSISRLTDNSKVFEEAKVVNGYVLHEVIGKGSFGVVRRAKKENSSQVFAVKIQDLARLKKKYMLHGKNHFTELQREVAILKKANHPNVLALYEVVFDKAEQKVYFFTEFVEKGTITLDPSPGAAEMRAFRSQLYELFEAVDYLHNFAKIVHCDIKPENILLDAKNQVRLIDFGCSKLIDRSPLASVFNGTKSYQPPEVDNKTEIVATKVDVWAIGITLYKLLTGKFPTLDSPLSFPDFVPAELRDIVNLCLKKDPALRPPVEQLLTHRYFSDLQKPVAKPALVVVTDFEIQRALKERFRSVVNEIRQHQIKNKSLNPDKIKRAPSGGFPPAHRIGSLSKHSPHNINQN